MAKQFTINLDKPNYAIIRKDRAEQKGGGVCFILKDSLDFEQLLAPDNIEALIFKVKNYINSSRDMVVATYYNPPQATLDTQFIKELFNQHENVLLLGDLNCRSPLWKNYNSNGKKLEELLLANKLPKNVNTRLKKQTGKCSKKAQLNYYQPSTA